MAILKADYSNISHKKMAVSIGLGVKHIPILIESFIQESQSAIVSLKEAIDADDFDSIRRYAHFIKGSAGNLKFNEVYEMSKEMEFAATEKKEDFDYTTYFSAINAAISTINP